MSILGEIPVIGEGASAETVQQVIEQLIMPGIKGLAIKLQDVDKRLQFIENQPLQMTYIHKFAGPLTIKIVKDEEKV